MSLIIAGERSGVGKTTITLALLSYLKQQQFNVQSFKVGPDYIDPMFHQYITQKPCRNLDPILTSESYVKQCFLKNTLNADYAIIEGVMGLFDGIPVANSTIAKASTAEIALLLNLPILLVIDCSRLSSSVAAIAHGFTTLNPNLKFAGLVLNKVGSDRHLELLQDALEPLNLPILGVFRRQQQITIPDRHLGLVPTDELSHLNDLFKELADLAARGFNWEKLLPLLETQFADPSRVNNNSSIYALAQAPTAVTYPKFEGVKIGIARDAAFNFYYEDNLEILQKFGAELIFWSPLEDAELPPGIQGLYFGGGFPEVFADKLAQNVSVREAVKQAILNGIPTYAECGGLMYLCEKIVDFEGKEWSMVGVLPTVARMGKTLKLGYYQGTTLQDSPILPSGVTVLGHEFHRSELTSESTQPLYQMQRFGSKHCSEIQLEGWRSLPNIHGSYLHLHWGDHPEIPRRFLSYSIQAYSTKFCNT